VFDPMIDQAAGLRAVMAPLGIRLVPVVLSRDVPTAFDVLWTLGAGLSVLGQRVVALDATALEQPERPGLLQQMQRGVAPRQAPVTEPWTVLPAQAGLEALVQTASTLGPEAAGQRLVAAFPHNTVVLVLAPKEWLSVLLEGLPARPLVPMTLQPAGLVDAYSAVKVLHQAADLQPVLVPVGDSLPPEVSQQGLRVLQDTAQTHLGWAPDCWPLPESRPGESRDALSQWMLRIVDSALTLDEPEDAASAWISPHQREALVPQLWSC
jgi:hypothetical protein